MRGDFDEDELDDFEPDGYCDRCGGDGWILTCVDDMCHGLGYCIHGDGMELCACNTLAEPPVNAPAYWQWSSADGDPRDCASLSHPGCSRCATEDG
jgi:hypothetical protein